MDQHKQVVRRLLDVAGTTCAAEANVRISDKPMPLFQPTKEAKAPGLPPDWRPRWCGRSSTTTCGSR